MTAMPPLILIVCGGRDYADRQHVYATLDRIHAKRAIAMLREGGARGADALAGDWADSRGIPRDTCPAGWNQHGRAAGPIRNAAMLVKDPPANGVVAFPGGKGTGDMVRQAREAGVTVMDARRPG